MDDVLAEYEAWLRSWRASERTIRARLTLARSRIRAWGLDGFTAERIGAFIVANDAGEPRARWTTATYHNHLNDLCAWLVATGRLSENPAAGVRRAKRPSKLPRPLTDAEVDRVLEVVQGEVRDWIVLALLTGLRAFEVAKIRGEDVSADTVFVRGKGGVEAELPCHPDVWAMAQRYPRTGYWFPGTEDGHIRSQKISLTVGRIFTTLGIAGSLHRCRHTYGTRLMRSGVNMRIVQTLMRHASLETTAGYTAVLEDEQRDAIVRLTA